MYTWWFAALDRTFILISVFLVRCDSKVALVGTTTELCCNLTDNRLPQFILWTKDDSELSKSIYAETLLCYIITNTSYNDAGIYGCHLIYQEGLSTSNQTVLHVHDYLEFYGNCSSSTENTTIFASCCVNYSPSSAVPDIRWMIDTDASLPTLPYLQLGTKSHDRYAKSVCSIITFPSRRQNHGKTVLCSISDETNVNASTKLNVTYSPTARLNQITSSDKTFPDEIWDNQTAYIECVADGNPKPLVSLENKFLYTTVWHEGTYDSVTNIDSNNNYVWKFILPNVTRNASGEYRCKATNNVGQYVGSESKYLDVKYPATITLLTKSPVTVEFGRNVTIVCATDANPLPKVSLHTKVQGHWIELPSHAYNVVTSGYISRWKFQFRNITDDSKGEYRCAASNRIGQVALSEVILMNIPAQPFLKRIAPGQTHLIVLSTSLILVLASIVLSTWLYLRRKRTSFNITRRNSRLLASFRRTRFPDVIETFQDFQGAACSSFQESLPNHHEATDKSRSQYQRQDNLSSISRCSSGSDYLNDFTCGTMTGAGKAKRGSNCDSYGYAYVHELRLDGEKTDINCSERAAL